ncbi:MAG: endonuclease/exonuclease/phosphatase family protein [Bryobacterales bacterium]
MIAARCVVAVLTLGLFPGAGAAVAADEAYVRYQEPELFSYEELVALVKTDEMEEQLAQKLTTLRTTPFLSNEAHYRGAQPHRPNIEGLGASLRVVMWNIERGFTLDSIKALFTDTNAFLKAQGQTGGRIDANKLLEQIEVLQSADVLVLNEVDWGLKRTDYRIVVRELGEALNMNWAYGVEFIEVDPITLGIEQFEEMEDEAERKHLVADLQVDQDRLKALHGTAILSRYPIAEARLRPFEYEAYNWFQGEKQRVSPVEIGKRGVASRVFLEKVSREIRRGGRTCLIVTLDVPDLTEKKLTIVAPHLENRAEPKGRHQQMEELLRDLRGIDNPLILAGDLNTTLSDTSPTDVKREIYRRVGSSEFWATTGIKYATGVGLIYDVVKGSVNFFKNQSDPTAKHVPVIGPNPESKLFNLLEDFRFSDGTTFDFRGDKNRTINGTEGTLANSNQRDSKGFALTYQVNRTIGPAGKLKLDWILVKPYIENARSSREPYRFSPHFARTMNEVNYSLAERLSDHNPITVDLPFEEPGVLTRK